VSVADFCSGGGFGHQKNYPIVSVSVYDSVDNASTLVEAADA